MESWGGTWGGGAPVVVSREARGVRRSWDMSLATAGQPKHLSGIKRRIFNCCKHGSCHGTMNHISISPPALVSAATSQSS